MKKYFSGRELEKWPWFETIGGYDGLAADAHKAGSSVGLARYRVDGLFSLSPEPEKTGEFTTGLIVASGVMTANAEIADDGFLEIELLDGSGRKLPAFNKRLSAANELDLALFSQLPGEPFRVRARMQNATLYSISYGAAGQE